MKNVFSNLGIAFILIAILANCTSPGVQTKAAYWPTDGWRTTAPEEQGMDSEVLAQMVEHIQTEQLPVHSLLIVRNGYLVSEIYGYPYSANQVHWIASVTKSVTSALVGIAIEQGYIKNVHQPLSSLLPDSNVANLDEAKKAITLENFLTLTTGLDCSDNRDVPLMLASTNWVDFTLSLPMATKPGTQFNYCTDAVHVLSAILQKATGMSTRELANKTLFAPIGIGPIPEERWPSDPQGVTHGGEGLILTPQEMAKFGYLMLNHGKWDGKTIIPANWVSASTKKHIPKDEKNGYGYLWTISPDGKYYSALGLAGQHIFVFPNKNMVVVFTSDLPLGNNADLIPLEKLLNQYILPAVKSNQPLPANPDAVARFEAGVQAMAQPKPVHASLPAIAEEISDKTFTLNDNPFGWQTIVFSFKDDEATVTTNDAQTLAIGLDNVYRMVPSTDGVFSESTRAYCENENTLIIEDIYIGQMQRIDYRVKFSKNTIDISGLEKYSGIQIELHGSLNN